MIHDTLPPPRLRRRATRISQFRAVHQLLDRQRQLRKIELDGIEYRLLAEPVFMGWERYFVVRHDLRRSPEGPYLERLLVRLQFVEACSRDGIVKRRDWTRGSRLRVVEHRLKSVDAGIYWAMTEKMQRYFDLHILKRRNPFTRKNDIETVFVLAQPWKFVTKVRECWKTHEKVYTVNVDSEKVTIEHHLHGPSENLYRHWARHVGDCYRNWDDYAVPPADERRAPASDIW